MQTDENLDMCWNVLSLGVGQKCSLPCLIHVACLVVIVQFNLDPFLLILVEDWIFEALDYWDYLLPSFFDQLANLKGKTEK